MILADRAVLVLGLVQTAAETSMYIFVFLWTPVLDPGAGAGAGLGWVFSCFMLAMMLGSQLTSRLAASRPQLSILRLCLLAMSASLAAAAVTSQPGLCPDPDLCRLGSFLSFLVLETAIGAYYPAISSLRSRYIPEQVTSSLHYYSFTKIYIFHFPDTSVAMGIICMTMLISYCWVFPLQTHHSH